jgi:hypothetical protein
VGESADGQASDFEHFAAVDWASFFDFRHFESPSEDFFFLSALDLGFSFGFLSALADDDAARRTCGSEASVLPARAGVKPESPAAITTAVARPTDPIRMRDITTSLFRRGGAALRARGLGAPAALSAPQGRF